MSETERTDHELPFDPEPVSGAPEADGEGRTLPEEEESVPKAGPVPVTGETHEEGRSRMAAELPLGSIENKLNSIARAIDSMGSTLDSVSDQADRLEESVQ